MTGAHGLSQETSNVARPPPHSPATPWTRMAALSCWLIMGRIAKSLGNWISRIRR
jgi:hypothetical protein